MECSKPCISVCCFYTFERIKTSIFGHFAFYSTYFLMCRYWIYVLSSYLIGWNTDNMLEGVIKRTGLSRTFLNQVVMENEPG